MIERSKEQSTSDDQIEQESHGEDGQAITQEQISDSYKMGTIEDGARNP